MICFASAWREIMLSSSWFLPRLWFVETGWSWWSDDTGTGSCWAKEEHSMRRRRSQEIVLCEVSETMYKESALPVIIIHLLRVPRCQPSPTHGRTGGRRTTFRRHRGEDRSAGNRRRGTSVLSQLTFSAIHRHQMKQWATMLFPASYWISTPCENSAQTERWL